MTPCFACGILKKTQRHPHIIRRVFVSADVTKDELTELGILLKKIFWLQDGTQHHRTRGRGPESPPPSSSTEWACSAARIPTQRRATHQPLEPLPPAVPTAHYQAGQPWGRPQHHRTKRHPPMKHDFSMFPPPHNHHGGGGITDECDNGKAIHQTPRDQPQDKKAIAAAGERRPSNSAGAVASSRCWRCMTGISLCYAAPPMMSSSTLCMPA